MASFKVISVWCIFVTCVLVNIADIKASTEYNRYLAHIFQKYGNGGTMSFEVSFEIRAYFNIIATLAPLKRYKTSDLYFLFNS